ncbi:MAG: sensor histidine kinase [Ancrocorticia sp.]
MSLDHQKPARNRGYNPPDVYSRELKRETMFYGGFWLIFLAFPVVSIFSGDMSWPLKALGLASVAAFVVLYMYGLTHPRIVFSVPRWANTLAYTVILVLFMVVVAILAGSSAISMASYLLALWLFSHTWRVGVLGAVVVAVAVVLGGVLAFPAPTIYYTLIPVVSTLAILVIVRLMSEKDERDREKDRQLALSRQREELARTVHDVLGHSLTAITVSAQLARRLVERDPQAAAAQLDNILATARTALSEVRTTVVELRQPDLMEQVQMTRTLLEAAGIAAELPRGRALDMLDDRLNPETRELFAWCLREGITNVVRHAGASRCSVEIGERYLRIDDDGAGVSRPEGNGLTGLRQRVEEAGGVLSIGAPPVDRPPVDGPPVDRRGTRMEVVL